jgi:hypothetical protein
LREILAVTSTAFSRPTPMIGVSIRDQSGELVGLCFVDLLPGVRNEKINPFTLVKQSRR